MNFGTAIATGFHKYSDFTGTSSRSEFWWFQLFVTLVFLGTSTLWGPLGFVWMLIALVPYFASWVRRLRDAGFPWGLIFLAPVPVIGTIVLIVLWVQPTKAPLEG
jgi:uncharacterized membrane protein YhaH (DUF805 family)